MDNPDLTASDAARARELALGRLSLRFMLGQVVGGVAGLSALDALLVMAINQANISPLTREPLARMRYGRMEAAAPDSRRRSVSINAVATSLDLPFETVRRRVRKLEAGGIVQTVDGGLVVPEAFLTSPAYVQSVIESHVRLQNYFHAANAAGLLDRLPRSSYPPEPSVPVRAAARLLSDYLLRTAAGLMALCGDLVSVTVFLGVAACETDPPGAAALAKSLMIPAETARRHLLGLLARGLIVRHDRGFLVSPDLYEQPEWRAFLQHNAIDAQRLFAGLAERGVIEAWGRLAPPLSGEDVSQARS